jgi:hypothetical protein
MVIDIGNGIEGMTGSSFKIDITFFSSHINFLKILQKIGQKYQINILISNDVSEKMSNKSKEFLRAVDIINKENDRKESNFI